MCRMQEEILAEAPEFRSPYQNHSESYSFSWQIAPSQRGCHFPEVEKAGVGRVVRPEPEALSMAITNLLENPKELREMGEKGRAFVERHYSWDIITDQLLDAYSEGIDRSNFNKEEKK